MRRIIWSMLIVSAAVGLAMLMRLNHGNIAVLWPPYRIDFSVNLAMLVLVVAFVVMVVPSVKNSALRSGELACTSCASRMARSKCLARPRCR